MWPDLAKFCHFGKIFQVFGNLFEGLFSLRQNLESILATIFALGHIWVVLNGQILNKYYSHLVTLCEIFWNVSNHPHLTFIQIWNYVLRHNSSKNSTWKGFDGRLGKVCCKKNFLLRRRRRHWCCIFVSKSTMKKLRCRVLLSGFVCAFHPAAPGSTPKHTIYAFII